MRRAFHPILLEHMRKDDRIRLVTADLGFKMLDAIRDEFPDRLHNVGAAEQLMLGTAVGLAEDGLIACTYTISAFYWRASEWIRNFLDHEKVPVKLLGGGRGNDYKEDKFTHYCGDDQALFGCFPNIVTYWPQSSEVLPTVTKMWLYNNRPSYLNLCR